MNEVPPCVGIRVYFRSYRDKWPKFLGKEQCSRDLYHVKTNYNKLSIAVPHSIHTGHFPLTTFVISKFFLIFKSPVVLFLDNGLKNHKERKNYHINEHGERRDVKLKLSSSQITASVMLITA